MLLKPATGRDIPVFQAVLEELLTSEHHPETAKLRCAVKVTQIRLGKHTRHTNPERYRHYCTAVCNRLEREGPEGLEKILDRLQERIENDPETAIEMARRAILSRVVSKEDKELLKDITREATSIDNEVRAYVVERATAKLELKLFRQAESEQRKRETKLGEKKAAAKEDGPMVPGLFLEGSRIFPGTRNDGATAQQTLRTVTFNLSADTVGEMAVFQLGRILSELGRVVSEKREEKRREEDQKEHRREMFQVARDMVMRLVGPPRSGREAEIMSAETQIQFRNDLFVDEAHPMRVVEEILRARREGAAA